MDVADRLFYRDGIHATGIDRLIMEAPTTKATFYKHYGSKDAVILTYVRGRAEQATEGYRAAISHDVDGIDQLHALVKHIATEISRPGYRGSALSNAAVEFPLPSHPVRQAVAAHRDWVTDFFTEVFERAGSRRPGDDADQFLLAVDGAQCGSYAGDAIASRAAFVRTAESIIESLGVPALR
jgi:AcrR family transcriptional regulator